MRGCVVAALMTGYCGAQERPAIRVDVSLVNVAFTVRDANGVTPAALTKDDFDVFEDGAPQKISFFARGDDIPLTLGLVVDVSGSQEHFFKQHDRHVERFLKDVLGPRDRAFLVCFGNHIRLASDLSPSPGVLMEGMNNFHRGVRNLIELGPPELRELGTAFYDAIYYSVTEKLAKQPGGRKALIVFSDGEDNSSAHHMLEAIEAAQTEDVRVFGIRYTETKHGRLTARNKYGTSVMRRIGLETGGADFDAMQTKIEASFREIGDDLRSAYELAYVPSGAARDGSFHKITIRPKRPGLSVRVKTGYFAR